MARIELQTISDEHLESLIDSYRTHDATDRPEYRLFIEEHNRRSGGNLDLQKTVDFVLRRARERRFSSYGEIAKLHGAKWSKVRYLMPHHLWAVVQWARSRQLPMLSAVIVSQKHVQSGHMEPQTLEGFIRAAQALGYEPNDWQSFLREQQQECFAMAKNYVKGIVQPTARS